MNLTRKLKLSPSGLFFTTDNALKMGSPLLTYFFLKYELITEVSKSRIHYIQDILRVVIVGEEVMNTEWTSLLLRGIVLRRSISITNPPYIHYIHFTNNCSQSSHIQRIINCIHHHNKINNK
ncbi:MAG: hypothetical protein [Cressdnaviricota sp.]|nr:MAG: hypothetical protein [Cressdnaviricota sp.]